MEINEKKKNSKAIIFIFLLIIVVLVAVAGFAYARYITSLNGSTEAPIAKWNFKVTANSKENLNIDLAETRLVNDTAEVDRTKVAPGTKGKLILNLDASRKSSIIKI